MYQVRLFTALPDGERVSRTFGHLFEDEAKAEEVAFTFLGMDTERGTIVSSQVWTTGDGASLLNEFEA